MKNELKEKYGLWTAIAMVVGIVIGSGVFFKAEMILNATGGDLPIGILAWLVGGLIMIIVANAFAVMASKYEFVNGVVDYAEVVVGKKYGYFIGWYMSIIYYPAITSVLAWLSARYTCVLLGLSITGPECMMLSAVYLIGVYAMNMLSPIIAGKFQVSTTIIKLVPLVGMAVIGTITGLINGVTAENFTTAVSQDVVENPFFAALVSTAFAYEGWIIATSINSELKDAKRNMPRALTIGSLIIVCVYMLYYIGLSGVVPNEVLMESGEQGALIAFKSVFGAIGSFLFVFVIISCLGTLNGLMMGTTRGLYALSVRGKGPKPQVMSQVDKATNMPTNSGVLGVFLCAVWLFFFYGANLVEGGLFGAFAFDSSELPIIALYIFYIPIFVMFIKKEKDFHVFKRVILPLLATACCIFMMFAVYYAHGKALIWFIIVFVAVMLIGVGIGLFKDKGDTVQGSNS
jgi:APA family basic amino acid/polyamine antiporter